MVNLCYVPNRCWQPEYLLSASKKSLTSVCGNLGNQLQKKRIQFIRWQVTRPLYYFIVEATHCISVSRMCQGRNPNVERRFPKTRRSSGSEGRPLWDLFRQVSILDSVISKEFSASSRSDSVITANEVFMSRFSSQISLVAWIIPGFPSSQE